METLQDLVVAFSAQRDTLLDRLRVKLDQLKEVCLQESVSCLISTPSPLPPSLIPPSIINCSQIKFVAIILVLWSSMRFFIFRLTLLTVRPQKRDKQVAPGGH